MTNLEDRIKELDDQCPYGGHYVHEDGSHSFVINQDYWDENNNPRNDDGNVTTLIQDANSDYSSIDDDDARLSEARERWGEWKYTGHPYRSTRQPQITSWTNVGQDAMTRGGYDLQRIMERYIAMFRPDVVYYADDWQVSGNTQSEWAGGWGYITRDAMVENFGEDWETYLAEHDLTLEKLFEQEVDLYEKYFSGEVYTITAVRQGEPIVVYAEQGAYVDDYNVDEDTVGGFLGDDEYLKSSAVDVAGSPIREEAS